MALDSLASKARDAMKMAHAPYSKFTVGCALESSSGKVFIGCNVENASYGATLCAERVAISLAVSQGEKKFKKLVLISKNPEPIMPCGMCRQVMAEFFSPSTIVVSYGSNGKKSVTYKFSELFPHSFTNKDL